MNEKLETKFNHYQNTPNISLAAIALVFLLWVMLSGFYEGFATLLSYGIDYRDLDLTIQDYEKLTLSTNIYSAIIMLMTFGFLKSTAFGKKVLDKLPNSMLYIAIILSVGPIAFFILLLMAKNAYINTFLWLLPIPYVCYLMKKQLSPSAHDTMLKAIAASVLVTIVFSVTWGIVAAQIQLH